MTCQITDPPDCVNQLFRCLGHPRRRTLIGVVADEPTPLTLDGVVEGIAARESDAVPASTSFERPQEIAITVVHIHLPKLRDAGIIDADDEASAIYEGDRFDAAITHLDLV